MVRHADDLFHAERPLRIQFQGFKKVQVKFQRVFTCIDLRGSFDNCCRDHN